MDWMGEIHSFGPSLLLAAICSLVILFEDIQRIAVMVLHTHRTQYGSDRARGTALLPDHLAHIRGGNPEPEYRALVSFDRFNNDCLGNIHQRACNLSH